MKCIEDDCENERFWADNPQVSVFQIPFTNWEIQFWNWNKKTEMEHCESCICEIDQHKYDSINEQIYNDGCQHGYEEAYKETK